MSNVTDTFMRVSPIPQRLLAQYDLVQKKSSSNKEKYKDVLVYRKGYRFNPITAQQVMAYQHLPTLAYGLTHP